VVLFEPWLALTLQQKETDEYWRRIVGSFFADDAEMTISLPKDGPRDPNRLAHTAIVRTFKAIWVSGVQAMSFSIDGAKEHEHDSTFVLHCPQARWRMHYFSGYMVELHGTLKVVCTLNHNGIAWRVQIQRFDLDCVKEVKWLAKDAITAGSFRELIHRGPLPISPLPGVGPDAESNRYMRRGEVVVPTTPLTRHGLTVPAMRTLEVCFSARRIGCPIFLISLSRCMMFSRVWLL
jgi:LIM-domain binding protein